MVLKQMALKYAGVCRACRVELPARTKAVYDSGAKNVLCLECRDADLPPPPPALLPPPQPIDHGVAGAGPQHEYERRMAKHERNNDGTVDERQSTKAWLQGAEGERQLATELEARLDPSAVVLHSRRVPNTRGDIDHLIVAATGIWLVDAKNYSGEVECRDVGKRLTIDRRLYVGGRDKTNLTENFEWQTEAVHAVLDPMGFGAAPVYPTLVFTQWQKKAPFQKPIEIRGVRAMWTRRLVELVNQPGPLTDDAIRAVATQLSAKLPAKG